MRQKMNTGTFADEFDQIFDRSSGKHFPEKQGPSNMRMRYESCDHRFPN